MDSPDTFLLIRSARRTLTMEIKPDATVVVRAPKRLPLREIQRFIASHDDWINRKQSQARSRPQPQAKEFVDGEKFLITGNSCELLVVGGTSKDVDFDGRLLLSAQALPHAREAVTKWYRKQARAIFNDRVQEYSRIMGCRPAGIRITSPRRRWGSCGIKNCLNFNWRLVMAPPEIIDYVVIHELAHIKHKHHGRDFWDFVEEFAPRHRKTRLWLKEHGHSLDF